MTRGFRLTAIAALAIVAALALFVSSRDTVAVPTFEPGGFACFEIAETAAECDGDSSPGAVTDIHGGFCIGWNQDCSVKDSVVTDSNFGGVVGFGDPVFVGPDTPPKGTIVGRLTSQATLGLLSNPCSTVIGVAFTLMMASIDITDTIAPLPVGESDVMEPMALDADGNGLSDGVDKYPLFLNEAFDDKQPIQRLFGISFIQGSWISLNFLFFNPGETFEFSNQDLTLDASLGVPSVTVLQDPTVPAAPSPVSDFCAPLLADNITLGQTIDNPCTPVGAEGAACPDTKIFENRGYPLFPCETGGKHDDDGDGKINDGCPQVGATAETGAECDNDVSDDLEDSDVNDGCPQSGDQSEAERAPGACSGNDEGGCIFRRNPATAGTFTGTILTVSQRDADGDGIENSLDVCALTPNPEWDPRSIPDVDDPDFDGIPNACDPFPNEQSGQSALTCPAGITGPDEDGDCFSNRADNCPFHSQLEFPDQNPGPNNLPDLNDEDSDGLGDICDPDPNDPDAQGVPAYICLNFSLEVGGAQKSVATYNPDRSLNCATSSVTPSDGTPAPTPTLAPGQTPGPGGPGGNGGVGGGPDTGIGSLSPTATNVSIWAIALAAIGGIGILAGVRILRSRRVDRED